MWNSSAKEGHQLNVYLEEDSDLTGRLRLNGLSTHRSFTMQNKVAEDDQLPSNIALFQIYPNPFIPTQTSDRIKRSKSCIVKNI